MIDKAHKSPGEKKCPWNITIHVTQTVSGKIPKKLVTVIVSGKKNRGVLSSGVSAGCIYSKTAPDF